MIHSTVPITPTRLPPIGSPAWRAAANPRQPVGSTTSFMRSAKKRIVSASLRLAVTPQITAEGTVILDINVENNTPDFVNRVGADFAYKVFDVASERKIEVVAAEDQVFPNRETMKA